MGDDNAVLFWIAQFLIAVSRYISKQPSNKLQAALFFDEADMYLPAQSKPATKEPMENLLKRARSGGVSILLATQSPGDMDYRCKDNIRSWFIGRIKEPTALRKLKPMFSGEIADFETRLAERAPGSFYYVRDNIVNHLHASVSIAHTTQLSEEQIIRLAGSLSQ